MKSFERGFKKFLTLLQEADVLHLNAEHYKSIIVLKDSYVFNGHMAMYTNFNIYVLGYIFQCLSTKCCEHPPKETRWCCISCLLHKKRCINDTMLYYKEHSHPLMANTIQECCDSYYTYIMFNTAS